MANMFFFDTETTGLKSDVHSIFQIAAIIEIDDKVVFRKSYFARPLAGTMVSPEALEINHMTMEQLRAMPPAEETWVQIKRDISPFLLDNRKKKYIASGYNCGPFDVPFFKEWVIKIAGFHDYNKFFWVGSVDVMCMALLAFKETRHEFANFKQETVAKALGIDVDKASAHEGLYDVGICYNIFRSLEKKPLVNFNDDQATPAASQG